MDNNVKLSCGVLIQNEHKELLLGLVTGSGPRMDVPKGMKEEDENALDCAVRECWEETGFKLNKSRMKDLGIHAYLKNKKLWLFKYDCVKSEFDLTQFKCSSFFEVKSKNPQAPAKQLPEISGVRWVSKEELERVITANLMATIKDLID